MTTHKTADLIAEDLDRAVAIAEGWEILRTSGEPRRGLLVSDGAGGLYVPTAAGLGFQPSRKWEDAGPIIERERIELSAWDDGSWGAHTEDHAKNGPTPLIAAMRAYVASRFGETVELP